jgi:hypothetical protein
MFVQMAESKECSKSEWILGVNLGFVVSKELPHLPFPYAGIERNMTALLQKPIFLR